MTGEDICVLAELNTEELDVDRTSGLKWINECLIMDIGKDAGAQDAEVVTVTTADAWTALTKSFLDVIEITQAGYTAPYFGRRYSDFYSGDFELKEGYIRLPITGTFTIRGFVLPTVLSAIGSSVSCHPALHPAISLYVASKTIAQDDEDNPNAKDRMDKYFYYKNKALKDIQRLIPKRPLFVKSRAWV